MSIDLPPRKTFRGVRKCKSCGILRANRSKTCKNTKCVENESIVGSLSRNKLDSVKLISFMDSMIFSVQSKEKESKRDFVQITEITLISDESNSIVSQNAICFLESCKHVPREETVSCKHVQSATECKKIAVEIIINKKVLFDLNISQETKVKLWKFYNEQKSLVPPVQKVASSVFTVASSGNLPFPAKRLHVKLKENFSCACKRLKLMMTADESFVFKDDLCEHVLLVLAGVLSSEILREDFKGFLSEVSSVWSKHKATFHQNEIGETLKNSCEMASSHPAASLIYRETSDFTKWMNFVIESINMTLSFKTLDINPVSHSFHIHVDTFETLANRFSKGNKRMLPIKKFSDGYAWRLLTSNIVKKIFSTEEISIALERKFHREADDFISLEEFLAREKIDEPVNFSKIIPKLSSIWIDIDQARSCGVKIIWTPNVFPQSKFGLLVIQYALKYSHPFS